MRTTGPAEVRDPDVGLALKVTWWRRLLPLGLAAATLLAGGASIAYWLFGDAAFQVEPDDPLLRGLALLVLGLLLLGRARGQVVLVDPRGITVRTVLTTRRLRWKRIRGIHVVRDERLPGLDAVVELLVWGRHGRSRRPGRRVGRWVPELAMTVSEEADLRGIPTSHGPLPPPGAAWRLHRTAPAQRSRDGSPVLRRPVLTVIAALVLALPAIVLVAAAGVVLGRLYELDGLARLLAGGAPGALLTALAVRRGLRAAVLLGADEVVVRNLASGARIPADGLAWVGVTGYSVPSPRSPMPLIAFGPKGRRRVVRALVSLPGRRRSTAWQWCVTREWSGARGVPNQPVVRTARGVPAVRSGTAPADHPWQPGYRRR